MAAAISPFELTEPSQPMISDDEIDEDRPQHWDLHVRSLLFLGINHTFINLASCLQ